MTNSDDPARLADSLRWHRKRVGLSQEELAERSGVSVRTVRNLELGRVRQPRPNSVQLLGQALGVNDLLAAPGLVIPALLPWDVHHFTGRSDELSMLDELVRSRTSPLMLLSGTAGVGKTALAVHWAHRRASWFPDGQLYVDLRGYDTQPPSDPQEVLGAFLRRLGGPQVSPADADERAALYRDMSARRRLLVVLDNARSAEQVRPLLPGGPGCTVLVTSRDALPGLVAREGADRLEVGLLAAGDARDLLRLLLGARVDAELDATAELLRRCGGLPLALRVLAEQLSTAGGPLVAALEPLSDRLGALDTDGDPRAGIRSVFSWSVDELPAAAARAFRLLGLHPGSGIDRGAFAALAGVGHDEAGQLAVRLVRAHLLTQTTPDRFALHDLLRAYAAELAELHLADEERTTALEGLVDHLQWTAALAVEQIMPTRAVRPRRDCPATVSVPADEQEALGWLDTERTTLTWTAGWSAREGHPEWAVELAPILWPYLYYGGHQADAQVIVDEAIRAAGALGDSDGKGFALSRLSILHERVGDYPAAVDAGRRALAAFKEAGAPVQEARGLLDLGVTFKRWGRHAQAVELYQRAIPIFREHGRSDYAAMALDNLGLVHELRGDAGTALTCHEQAHALFERVGERNGAARALANRGQALLRLGRLDEAGQCLDLALAELAELGDRDGQAHTLDLLAQVAVQSSRPHQAVELGLSAVQSMREVNDRDGEAEALDHLGSAYLILGDPVSGLSAHRSALQLADRIGAQRLRARALNGIGECLTATGRVPEAVAAHDAALAAAEQADDPKGQTRARDGRAAALAMDHPGPGWH